ncbi:MAG: MFS transporter [Actinomycetota bacterium]|nr:MFS transporter [Actinomycetota bacterium]
MTTTTTGATAGRQRGGFVDGLFHRQLHAYPDTGPRIFYLAVTVAATAILYYELYCSASVATLQLATLHMSFTFYVTLLAVANLIGAFGSLLAGITDRLGRTNLVVAGLLIVGAMIAFVIPATNSKWTFGVATAVVGLVEGICLVATPALIRDFSPQLGRATAMGFWTMGPVLGSLIVSVVGTNTITARTTWPTEYRIAGIVGLAMFVVAFLFMRELSPGLRDQLMVSTRDRALIEARAKGLNIEEALRKPFRQMLHADVLASALGIAVFLLIYYTAVAFFTTYFVTTFGFTLSQANGLGNWNWGFNLLALVIIGALSDKIRVRKPFMIVGGVGSAVMIVVFLRLATHPHTGYYHLAVVLLILAVFLGIAYTPWMASFTETVESHNPALTATGLAVWGWIIRVVIFVAYIILPHVVTSTNALVNQGPEVQAAAAKYAPQVAFATAHPAVVATAQKYTTQLTDAQKFAPELAVIEKNPGLFTELASNPTLPALQARAVAAAGGGAQGATILQSIATNQAAITGVIAVAPQLQTVVPFAAQLTALQKAASQPDFQYLQKNAPAVQKAAKDAPSEWQNYYWICFGGVIVFLTTVPLMRGRWSPKKAREDTDAHEALVQAEMAKLNA